MVRWRLTHMPAAMISSTTVVGSGVGGVGAVEAVEQG
jgi:hypothetical protein